MNPIKTILFLVLSCSIISSCSNDDADSTANIQPHVRFNFLVNSNNVPLEFPAVNGNLVAKSTFTNTRVKPLKIPVTLTSNTLKNAVTVGYSITSSGSSNAFSISPSNQLSFQGNQLTDTIYVNFNERLANNESVVLKLESVSDASIKIGNLNTVAINDTFTINFGDINTTYTLPSNRIEINGELNEKIPFKVNYPNGFFPFEIENLELFEFLDGFDYSLTVKEIDDKRTYVIYEMTLNENIQNDDVYYQTLITLISADNYKTIGNTTLQIVKPIKTPRDKSANTAANFYNLSDPFYRTYGETWNDFNKDGICQWGSFNAFTYPIVVTADSPNAILYDNRGNTDPSDDIYHDAFRIGFKTPNTITTTTNSFNLKRWFSNESTSGINSPGFDVNPALEFFPENGNSRTKGTVLVIPQYLTIAGTNSNSYSIAISGDGTYEEISAGLFEISLEFKATNQALFGGSISVQYKIYNKNTYTDPADLTNTNCVSEYDL
jgi:hypothetical protein